MAEVVENSPDLWKNLLPRPKPDGHKYDRGHTAILGSDQFTGATRLAAEACSRIGSGLVSVLSEHQAQLYRTVLPPDTMVTEGPLAQLKRLTTLLAGPGGCSDAQALAVLQSQADLSLVLDADAIRLWPELSGRSAILTPHEGEFARYFPMIEGAADPIGNGHRHRLRRTERRAGYRRQGGGPRDEAATIETAQTGHPSAPPGLDADAFDENL